MGEVTRRNSPPRVFPDTSVFFSGFHSPTGPPGVILRHFAEGVISVVVSRQVLQEVVRTLKKKLPDALPALRDFLLCSGLEVISDPDPGDVRRWAELLDAGDAFIIAAAVAAEPDFFVTGDGHFLENPRVRTESGIGICSPSEFLKYL